MNRGENASVKEKHQSRSVHIRLQEIGSFELREGTFFLRAIHIFILLLCTFALYF